MISASPIVKAHCLEGCAVTEDDPKTLAKTIAGHKDDRQESQKADFLMEPGGHGTAFVRSEGKGGGLDPDCHGVFHG